jgi:hypothetical protein
MNKKHTFPTNTKLVDGDLANRARRGRGISSQDPDPAAQVALTRKDAK